MTAGMGALAQEKKRERDLSDLELQEAQHVEPEEEQTQKTWNSQKDSRFYITNTDKKEQTYHYKQKRRADMIAKFLDSKVLN